MPCSGRAPVRGRRPALAADPELRGGVPVAVLLQEEREPRSSAPSSRSWAPHTVTTTGDGQALARRHDAVVGQLLGQRRPVVVGQVGVVGDPHRAVLEVVDGVLVAHRLVVDAAGQPDRRVRPAGGRVLRVGDVVRRVRAVGDLPRLDERQVEGALGLAPRPGAPGRPAGRRARRPAPATAATVARTSGSCGSAAAPRPARTTPRAGRTTLRRTVDGRLGSAGRSGRAGCRRRSPRQATDGIATSIATAGRRPRSWRSTAVGRLATGARPRTHAVGVRQPLSRLRRTYCMIPPLR